MPTLTIQLPGLPPVAHVLREETTTVGRMKGSTIILDDASVSLMHAKITRTKEGEYFLKDLNSTNGTLLNGQVVREVKLQDLDQICFADVIAQFHGEEAPRTVQPIVPLMQTPAAKNSPAPFPATAAVAGAPQLIQTKAVPEVPAKQRRTSNGPTGSGFNRLTDRAVPILGGVAALVVVALVVWKLFLSGNQSSDVVENKQPAATANDNQGKNSTAGETASGKNSATKSVATPKVVNPQIARLLTGLKDADVEERRRAARALQSMGAEAKEATAALTEALKDSDEEVQMLSAFTLVNNKSYDKRTIPILIRSLRHENATLRQVACLSLAIIPYAPGEKDPVIPALAAATANDDNEEVRKAAYSALNLIAPEIIAKANEK